jgi:DNA-binding NarL/FixJ family response regulator
MGELPSGCHPDRIMAIATLIVDDHDDIRLLLRLLLEAQPGIDVVGEAANGEEAIDQYRALRPTVMVLDEMMPGMSGLDVVRALRDSGEEPHIVLCSAHLDRHIVAKASELGIGCCISKADMERTVAAVRGLAGESSDGLA